MFRGGLVSEDPDTSELRTADRVRFRQGTLAVRRPTRQGCNRRPTNLFPCRTLHPQAIMVACTTSWLHSLSFINCRLVA